MSASSGIAVSDDLKAAFSDAVSSQSVRFLKISIRNESLVPDQSVEPTGTLHEDLDKLNDILEDDVPAYVLVRLDDPPSEWLAVSYVPDHAKVRDKMLYASSRSSLTKALGAAPFSDTLFATTKADLTADAYARHRASLAAPKPMTAREKEMEEVKAAESRSAMSQATRERSSPLGGVGLGSSEEVEQALRDLSLAEGSKVVILTIDPKAEQLQIHSVADITADELGSALPPSEPSYAFFAWARDATDKTAAFIYSCPSSSPLKPRMLYSAGVAFVFTYGKRILEEGSTTCFSRRVETSDPKEVNEEFLQAQVGAHAGRAGGSGTATPVGGEHRPFARPKGPGRKR